MPTPAKPKIYHIVHLDRLACIAQNGLFSDAEVMRKKLCGTTIGMNRIKQSRLTLRELTSHPGLKVGYCVPFYFCPRSVMLYVIHQANHPDLAYRGGQGRILHLQADLHQTVAWADRQRLRWAFTLSNAGSGYFTDLADLSHLEEIDWQAVEARQWQDCREKKQAEFLVEKSFPWELVDTIGVASEAVRRQVAELLSDFGHRPRVALEPDWYY